MQPTKRAPHGNPDPTPAEIEQRCAEVRGQWSAATERDRRVQHVAPVVYSAVDWASITGKPEWESVVTFQTTTHR